MNSGSQIRILDSEELLDTLIELRELAVSTPVIVEGKKDVECLGKLGVKGNIIPLNQGMSIIDFCSDLASAHEKVFILTDWDTKGNILCSKLKKGCKACDISFDTRLRGRLAALLKKDIKDIESIHSFITKNHPGLLDRFERREEIA